MSYGAKEIYLELSTNANITSLVDDISQGLLPKDLGRTSRTINFYRLTPIDVSLPFNQCTYTVNCRSSDSIEAEDIADKVIEELHRKFRGYYFLTFTKLPT
jgi:hypothetical protein